MDNRHKAVILERGETHKESKQLSVWGHYSRHSIGRETSSRETASLGGHRKLELRAAFVGRKHGNGSGGERERKIFNEVMAKFSPNLIKYSLTDPKNLKVTQLCPTLCDPMDYTVHGILQARILKWVAFPFCRGSSQPRDVTLVSHIVGGFFTS